MNHISDQEMRALTNQASGGPWEAREDDLTGIWKVEYDQECRHLIAEIGGAEWNSGNDAEFIAASRAWVPNALNRLEAVRELIDPTKATPGSTAHKILQTLNNTLN